MNKTKLVLVGLAITSMCFVSFAYAFLTALLIPSNGRVTTLQAYWDSACTNQVTSIDWGQTLAPGSTTTKDVWLKNWGGTSVLTLSLTTTNWNPTTATGYMSITWNREGATLDTPVLQCTLTLTVDADVTDATNPVIGPFANDIVITGTW